MGLDDCNSRSSVRKMGDNITELISEEQKVFPEYAVLMVYCQYLLRPFLRGGIMGPVMRGGA